VLFYSIIVRGALRFYWGTEAHSSRSMETKSAAKIKVGIVGASGYAGEDLVRLLLSHPQADLVAVTSRQYAGQTLAQIFPRYSHFPQAKALRFSEPNAELLAKQADVLFLALPHGVAAEYAVPLIQLGSRVIDLSADFRIHDPAVYKEYYHRDHPAPELLKQAVYGLPEIHREQIRTAILVACPGCYPTSILLPAFPLVQKRLVNPTSIIADSLSGVTGAGRKVEVDYLFAECNESLRPYGVPKHRHLAEIEQELSLIADEPVVVQFTPHLVPVNRGILTTLYFAPAEHFSDAQAMEALNKRIAACYEEAFGHEPFVRLLEGKALPDTKNVSGTNFIDVAWRLDPRTGRLIVMSAEDNLVKGTSGQAIQCFNIMNGIPETAGLL
jgi:N-acetyl-gamma-glutamyl-phosphate reductase